MPFLDLYLRKERTENMKNNFLGICLLLSALIIGGAITYNTYISNKNANISSRNDRYFIGVNAAGYVITVTDKQTHNIYNVTNGSNKKFN
jgi:uncharacterized protein YmfQ (DUF2313 family)